MKITHVVPARIGNDYAIQVDVDPHDGACRGQHNVAVTALPKMEMVTPPEMWQHAASLSWGPSVLLSVAGSREFALAVLRACEIAEQIERDGEYREAPE